MAASYGVNLSGKVPGKVRLRTGARDRVSIVRCMWHAQNLSQFVYDDTRQIFTVEGVCIVLVDADAYIVGMAKYVIVSRRAAPIKRL